MIEEYERGFVNYLVDRIKYDEIELPEGFETAGNIPYTDHKKGRLKIE